MSPALVFDLDGTLVDSAPDLHFCINVLLDELDLPALDLKTVTGFIGHGVPELVLQSLAVHKPDASEAQKAAAIVRYIEIYTSHPAQFCQPYKGVLETLSRLHKRGHKMAICTNKAEAIARLVANAIGLSDYCPVLIGGDSLPERKPDPAPLRQCMYHLNVESCIYVGDSETDARTAQNADVPFVLHTEGYRKTPIETLQFREKFGDWRDFPDVRQWR